MTKGRKRAELIKRISKESDDAANRIRLERRLRKARGR